MSSLGLCTFTVKFIKQHEAFNLTKQNKFDIKLFVPVYFQLNIELLLSRVWSSVHSH